MRTQLSILLTVTLLLPIIATSIAFSEETTRSIYYDVKPESPADDYFRPLVGGIKIEITVSGGREPPGKEPRSLSLNLDYMPNDVYVGSCSLGYPVIVQGIQAFVTAGHCFPHSNYEYNIYQPTVVEYNYIGYLYRLSRSVDAALIDVSVSVANKVLVIWDPVNNRYTLQPIVGTVQWNDQSYIGELVYKTGHVTGTTSGILINYYRYKYLNGKLLEFVVQAEDLEGARGDSGGTLYWLHPETGDLYLIGHVIGGNQYYTYSIHWYGVFVKLAASPLSGGGWGDRLGG